MVEEFFRGQYKVEKFLGAGGFADVYLVNHIYLNDRRAMKINKEPLPRENIDNIFKEARIATLIRHKNVISMHDAGIISVSGQDKNGIFNFGLKNKRDKNYAYFVMEYVVGGDLWEYWKSFQNQDKIMPTLEVLDIMKQIAMGLDVLHTNSPKIIHRDIKPQNLLMKIEDGKPLIKITDFGLANAKDSDKSFDKLSVAGTPLYMAPECYHKKFSTMSDIYAIGVIFYQLLTNEFPYEIMRFDMGDMFFGKPWERELKPPSYYNSDIPPKLDSIVMKTLAVNPKERYKDSGKLLKVIIDYMEDDLGVDETTMIYTSEISSSGPVDGDTDEEMITPEFGKSVEDLLSEAFKLAKQENRLEEAIEILEKAIINNIDVREKYTYRLRLWKDEMPDEKLKEEAFKVYSQANPNYSLASDLLQEAIAYNPQFNDEYEGYITLWSILSDLEESKDLTEAVNSLVDIMENYPYINEMYEDNINILKTLDANKIADESAKIIKKNKWDASKKIEMARIMEFAVLADDDVKEKYSAKLSLWKRGLSM
ncbi:serine/threonine-protein kinase [uncultured Methanobrevibacter sp.]|uniref:serine/threonine-protein kinase n=1 Tax=uncultured Methanobrevibacter sp. TaxID=253161 RepID=UPI0026140B80|nr:serine/threonine-protein kinase [uncultured Methanobrevibacter sp.]